MPIAKVLTSATLLCMAASSPVYAAEYTLPNPWLTTTEFTIQDQPSTPPLKKRVDPWTAALLGGAVPLLVDNGPLIAGLCVSQYNLSFSNNVMFPVAIAGRASAPLLTSLGFAYNGHADKAFMAGSAGAIELAIDFLLLVYSGVGRSCNPEADCSRQGIGIIPFFVLPAAFEVTSGALAYFDAEQTNRASQPDQNPLGTRGSTTRREIDVCPIWPDYVPI